MLVGGGGGGGFHFLGIYDAADKEGLPRVYQEKLIPIRSQRVDSLIAKNCCNEI